MQGVKICRDCCYFEKGTGDDIGVGRCKRCPPTLSPYLVLDQPKPRLDLTHARFEEEPWLFPIVNEDDWCGEFEL